MQVQPGAAQCAARSSGHTVGSEATWEELLPETLWAGGTSSRQEPGPEASRAEEQEEEEEEGSVETDWPP